MVRFQFQMFFSVCRMDSFAFSLFCSNSIAEKVSVLLFIGIRVLLEFYFIGARVCTTRVHETIFTEE